MQQKFNIVIFVIAVFLYPSVAYAENPEREENSAIPKILQPLDYAVFFEVNMADDKHLFLGTVVIRLECLQRTSDIILNMKDLFLEEDSIKVIKELPNLNYEELKTLGTTFDVEKQQVIISLEKKIVVKDILQMQLNYHKNIDSSQDPDIAFVKYSYSRKIPEISKWVAVSIPGAINARRLYPCIDEPGFKTEVRVTVIRDLFLRSLSNTAIVNDQISQNIAVMSEPYYNTPSLSTFSIGFVVGDLKPKLKTDKSAGIQIRIWSDVDVMEEIDFAGDTSVKVVTFYRDYFNSKLQVYKIDVVAVPFYGGTDKWRYGLITIEESLVTTENPSTHVKKTEIAFILCDVFCHQYFGPQITFKTWSENWLNMGLALFYRIPCFEHIFSNEKSISDIHLVESFMRVFSVNAEIKSNSLMVPDIYMDLTNLFQNTTSAETAYFLVRMMSYFLGKNTLTEQIKNYIAEFKFKVTSLDNLWERFPLGEKNSELLSGHVTFKDIMDSWTLKEGFAHIKMTRNKRQKFVTIQQELIEDSDEVSNTRIIPLSFITKSESTEKFNEEETVQYWLQAEPITIPVETNDWIVLNTKFNVLCRVEYDPITLKLLKETLMNKNTYTTIDVMSRTQLISDLFASAEMGKLSYSVLLQLIRYLKHEKSHLPIMVALHELKRIRLALYGTEIFSSFQEYVQQILNVIIRREKFHIREISEDNYEQHYFEKSIFTSACTFQVENCVNQSKAHFEQLLLYQDLLGKTDPIPAVLREPFYCQAIRQSGYKEWKFLFSFYSLQQWEYLNDTILSALACTADSDVIAKYLQRSLNSKKIASKDSLTVFKNLVSNERSYTIMKDFFRENVEEMLKPNAKNPSKVFLYLEILYENTWKQDDLRQLDAFTKINVPLKNIQMYLEKSKQITQKNISWLNKMEVEINYFFEDGYAAE